MTNAASKTARPNALNNFQTLPDDALARVATVRALFDCSSPTVWRWAASGKLPKPLKVGGITGWRVGDLRAILSGTR